MKKYIYVVVVIITLSLMSGCTLFPEKNSDFKPFKSAIEQTTKSTIYGIEYEKVQKNGNTIVYQNTVVSEIVSYEDEQAKVYFYEKELAVFPSDHQFNETEYTKYYDNDVVTLVQNEEITTIQENFDSLSITLNLLQVLDKKHLEEYNIEENKVSMKVLDESVSKLYDVDGITDLTIELVIEEKKLSTIEITYSINDSDFTITYQLTYAPYNSSILTMD